MMGIREKIAQAKEVDIFAELSPEVKKEVDLMAEIAATIHLRRIELGFTQKDLAQLCGVSQAQVSKWESGTHNFSLQTLSKILLVLNLEMSCCPTSKRTTYEVARVPATQNESWRSCSSASSYWHRQTTPACYVTV